MRVAYELALGALVRPARSGDRGMRRELMAEEAQ